MDPDEKHENDLEKKKESGAVTIVVLPPYSASVDKVELDKKKDEKGGDPSRGDMDPSNDSQDLVGDIREKEKDEEDKDKLLVLTPPEKDAEAPETDPSEQPPDDEGHNTNPAADNEEEDKEVADPPSADDNPLTPPVLLPSSHQERVVRPGAVSITSPWLVDNEDEDSIEDGADEENALDNDLIQAELVPDEGDESRRSSNLMTIDAEVLKDSDRPEYKRRRRIVLIVICVVTLASVVIATVVSVTNNNNGGGDVVQVSAAPSVSAVPTTPPSLEPSLQPSWEPSESPSETPTFVPSGTPSGSPSGAPTSLAWELVTTQGDKLDGRQAGFVPDGTQVNDGRFGSRIAMAEIQHNTPPNTTKIMLVINFARPQTVQQGPGPSAIHRDVIFYFCDLTGCHYGNYFALDAFLQTALSRDGTILALDTPLYGLCVYDLRTLNLTIPDTGTQPVGPREPVDLSGVYPPFRFTESSRWSAENQVALSHNGAYMVQFQGPELRFYNVGTGLLSGPSYDTVVNDSSFFAAFVLPEHPPFFNIPNEMSFSLVAGDNLVAYGTNTDTLSGLSPTVNGLHQIPFNGFSIRVYNSATGSQVGNTITRGGNWSLFSREGIAFAANDTFMAFSSATTTIPSLNSTPPAEHTHALYQIEIYQFVNDTNIWVPLGSPLTGQMLDDKFGVSLAFSEDGSVLAVGADLDFTGGPSAGSVTTYFLEGETLTFFEKLIGPTGSLFGSFVVLNASGDGLVVGAPASFASGRDSGEAFRYRIAGVTFSLDPDPPPSGQNVTASPVAVPTADIDIPGGVSIQQPVSAPGNPGPTPTPGNQGPIPTTDIPD